jgi:hypothetical protein
MRTLSEDSFSGDQKLKQISRIDCVFFEVEMIGKKRTEMGWQKMCAYMLIGRMGSITENI